jgi:hypothetical protein
MVYAYSFQAVLVELFLEVGISPDAHANNLTASDQSKSDHRSPQSVRRSFRFLDSRKLVEPIKALLGLALRQVLDGSAESRNLLPNNFDERRDCNSGSLLEDPKRIAAFKRMV